MSAMMSILPAGMGGGVKDLVRETVGTPMCLFLCPCVCLFWTESRLRGQLPVGSKADGLGSLSLEGDLLLSTNRYIVP